ncbi:MAG: glycosyltransferase [Verrucomicrobiota bacterium]|nr:glycosyltransferase [Verrucomicrobiota bacterium]
MPDVGPPEISVLIPAFNEEALLAKTLQGVRAAFESLNETRYEIIVCDNNSTDRTAEIAREGGAVVVVEEHNQIGRARNTAAASAKGTWYIFVDADTILPAEVLRETLVSMRSGKICAGGALIKFDEPQANLFGAALVEFWSLISRSFNYMAGSYIFCRADVFQAINGFDLDVYAGEEIFFSQKAKRWARKNGMKVRVLSQSIVTSARKLKWYTTGQAIRHIFRLAIPGALKKRENCDLWYTRPKS